MPEGTTGRTNTYSTSEVFFCFQIRPGYERGKIILDAGNGVVKTRDGTKAVVKPINGIYGLNLKTRESVEFTLFNTKYKIVLLEKDDPVMFSGNTITCWQKPLHPKNTLKGVQQRLQVLGYYPGAVDGIKGKLTERAILEFESDEGSLRIDGYPGTKTKNQLDTFFQTNAYLDNERKYPLNRRYLISIGRGKTGNTKWDHPHPDYRGGDSPFVTFGLDTSVVSWLFTKIGLKSDQKKFKLGWKAENISASGLKLYAKNSSGNDNIIKTVPDLITRDTSLGTNKHIIATAQKPGDETIEIHYQKVDGPVIALIEVEIFKLLQINVVLHLLNIKDTAGNAAASVWTNAKANSLLKTINAVWLPMGIEFKVDKTMSHTRTGVIKDAITNNEVTNSHEYLGIWRAYNVRNRLNIYFVNKLIEIESDGAGGTKQDTNTLGYAISRKAAGRNNDIGVCLKWDNDQFNLALTVAHELGHVLNLTMHPQAHSDEKPRNTLFRYDIWSRTRLMAMYSKYNTASPDRRWQDPGYTPKSGNNIMVGGWLTSKKLKNDKTDDEAKISRKTTPNPY